MFKIIWSFSLLFIFNLAHAQTQSFNLVLDADAINAYKFEVDPLQVSSSVNVKVSGDFESENFVLFRPTQDYNIRIVPRTQAESIPNSPSLPIDPIVTTIRTKPPGGGRPSLTRVTIHPVPVQNELTFTTSGNLVNGFKIYTNTGFLQISQSIAPTNTTTINVANLVAGNYVLRLELTNGQQLAIQFIKN